MIRIGFSRWATHASRSSERGGKLKFEIGLIPHSNKIRIIRKEWFGIRSEDKEVDLFPRPLIKTFTANITDSPRFIADLSNKVTSEAASEAINQACYDSIVSFNDIEKIGCHYLVKTALQRQIQKGEPEAFEPVDFVDFSIEIREAIAERKRQQQEFEERQEQLRRQHQLQITERQKIGTKAVGVSMELLFSILKDSEIEEVQKSGTVTIKTISGWFVVPITTHGLIKHYDDNGNYITSICIVFQDYSIPIGDEALMKIALIKANPKKLMDISNKFKETHVIKKLF